MNYLVDFKKFLGKESVQKETNPLQIFEHLDKESKKVELRRHQEKILVEWDQKFKNNKDIIVKLHTGEGKTLVGLLMLQSSLNANLGPAVYFCPDSSLVQQTISEAKVFGINAVPVDDDNRLPLKFLNSDAILVTTCHKLFNGKSMFGVIGDKKDSVPIGSLVMDDAHACIEIIRKSFAAIIQKKNGEDNLYIELWNLFQESLMRQGSGTCIDISEGLDDIISVPFWTWHDKHKDVLSILGKYKESEELRFVWDLLKNNLENCTCIFSGKEVQISPRLTPVELIPSFSNCKRRIFLSATFAEDAFLVKDLNIEPSSVLNPLTVSDVKYSGERMILIPTLTNSFLTRDAIIDWLSEFTEKHGEFGVVALVPSNKRAEEWESRGAKITSVKQLIETIENLKQDVLDSKAKQIIVLSNKYDGVDLPDNTCRILCLDSIPTHATLVDRYAQEIRPDSFIIRRQLSQKIEQGIGRAIRSISDWCIVILIENKLTSFVSEKTKREFLSNETKMQIEIAEKLAEDMKEEEGNTIFVIENLVKQCLNRDPAWREYYRTTMDTVKPDSLNKDYLEISKLEREADVQYQRGQYENAAQIIQRIIDQSPEDDAGWYFQLMASYLYPILPTEAMDKQVKAYDKNNRLYKPENGVTYSKLSDSSVTREESIIRWIKQHESHTSLTIKLMNLFDNLSFDIPSNSFEEAVKELGIVLGFQSQRPEKTDEKGPDNLWQISGKQFWLISCKNMVKMNRQVIHKKEVGQLNTDIAWFRKHYENCTPIPIFIHPAKILDSDAFLTETSYVITKETLDKLKRKISNFYNSLKKIPFEDISTEIVKAKLVESYLDLMSLKKNLEIIREHT